MLQVEDGKQGVIRPDVVAVKQSLDPAGLLNPASCAAGRCATSWNWTATRWREPPAKAPRPERPIPGRANRSLARFSSSCPRGGFFLRHSFI
ncbi:hypothetical protein LNP25_26295 [Klebsiella variicola subsp. variicola]|nr:hypothetical protein [Klebsiella variicola subsp. variicola]